MSFQVWLIKILPHVLLHVPGPLECRWQRTWKPHLKDGRNSVNVTTTPNCLATWLVVSGSRNQLLLDKTHNVCLGSAISSLYNPAVVVKNFKNYVHEQQLNPSKCLCLGVFVHLSSILGLTYKSYSFALFTTSLYAWQGSPT